MEKHRNIKIVIVEDDIYYNKVLTKYIKTICESLQRYGFQFTVVSYLNAHECIEKLDDDIDYMILDYYLDNKEEEDILNGEDVIREAQKYCPDCKIIVVSSLRNSHKTKELIHMGIHDYVDKNVNSSNRIGSILQESIKPSLN